MGNQHRAECASQHNHGRGELQDLPEASAFQQHSAGNAREGEQKAGKTSFIESRFHFASNLRRYSTTPSATRWAGSLTRTLSPQVSVMMVSCAESTNLIRSGFRNSGLPLTRVKWIMVVTVTLSARRDREFNVNFQVD